MPLDLDDPRPTYMQLAELLRQSIAEGAYEVGDRLPAVRTLASDYGVANATAARAVGLLQQQGIVVSRAGLGTVVRSRTALPPAPVQEQLDDLKRRVEALEARDSDA